VKLIEINVDAQNRDRFRIRLDADDLSSAEELGGVDRVVTDVGAHVEHDRARPEVLRDDGQFLDLVEIAVGILPHDGVPFRRDEETHRLPLNHRAHNGACDTLHHGRGIETRKRGGRLVKLTHGIPAYPRAAAVTS